MLRLIGQYRASLMFLYKYIDNIIIEEYTVFNKIYVKKIYNK